MNIQIHKYHTQDRGSGVSVSMVTTTLSSDFFSLPSSWAFLGSFQTVGSSSDALTVLRRSAFAS
jgi:hypothetical protein